MAGADRRFRTADHTVEDRIVAWATRVPGEPYRYGFTVPTYAYPDRFVPAVQCPVHGEALRPSGTCVTCVGDWYVALGYPDVTPRPCRVCGLPLHPVVLTEGQDAHPSCPDERVTP